jgi:hypothetical protein
MSDKCCNVVRYVVGPTGPTGPGVIGPIGLPGATGPIGPTGPTGVGCIGPPGPKTFVIDHPTNQEKYLVHACLEGPEAGVYYRGIGEITNGHSVLVQLPEYVDALASDFNIQVTGIYNGTKVKVYNVSLVEQGSFTVYGENGAFHWLVIGRRGTIDVEPNKSDVVVKGDGPYLWIA